MAKRKLIDELDETEVIDEDLIEIDEDDSDDEEDEEEETEEDSEEEVDEADLLEEEIEAAPVTKAPKKAKPSAKAAALAKTKAAPKAAPKKEVTTETQQAIPVPEQPIMVLDADAWIPAIKSIKDVPAPQRTRKGKWSSLASMLKAGQCVDNMPDRKAAIGLTQAIKKQGGTAFFRELKSGLYGVWKES